MDYDLEKINTFQKMENILRWGYWLGKESEFNKIDLPVKLKNMEIIGLYVL